MNAALRTFTLVNFHQLRYLSRRNPYPRQKWDEIGAASGTKLRAAAVANSCILFLCVCCEKGSPAFWARVLSSSAGGAPPLPAHGTQPVRARSHLCTALDGPGTRLLTRRWLQRGRFRATRQPLSFSFLAQMNPVQAQPTAQ